MSLGPEELAGAAEGYLLCSRKDGMGARFANLLWTWRLARAAGLRTLCFWPPMAAYYGDSQGAGDLIDVFRLATTGLGDGLQIIDGRPIDHLNPEMVGLDFCEPCDPRRHAFWPARIRSKSETVAVIDSTHGPFLMAGEDPAAAREQARDLFARLPLRAQIRYALKAAAKGRDFGRMVAVHVRGGDIVEVLKGACAEFSPEALEPGSVLDRYTEHFFRGCAPASAYLRLVRPWLKQGYRILFFSDTPGAAHPFTKRFGDRVVLAQDLAPPQLTGLQRALFESVLMSRCHAIIGTKSAFAGLASLIGGAPVTDVRRHASAEEFMSVYKKAIGFHRLDPAIRAGVTEVLVRKLQQNRMLDMWNAGEEDVLRLLDAA